MSSAFLKKVISTDPNSTPYSLDVHNCAISHLDNLNSLPKLRSIDVSFNNLQDLEGLQALQDLRELKAYSCKIRDCYGLGDWCPSLSTLLLNDNALAVVPKTFRKLKHLRQLNLASNNLEVMENLPPSITWLDASNNELTSDCGGLGLLAGLETLLVAGNELGPELPRTLASLEALEELNVNANHVSNLKNVPQNLQSLHINRNHLKDTLKFPNPLVHLTELHISGNRLTGLPASLHLSLPMLDLLDVTSNRIADLKSICNSVSGMKELRELNASGNPCTPLDVNGNIYGDACMDWWYEIAASGPQIEVLDDMVCTTEDVLRAKNLKKREVEVEERRAGGETKKAKARPKSARRKKVVVREEEKGESPKKGTMPLVKPPQAYSGREGVFGKLEPMDDIESKFKDIRAKLSRCKELTRPDGEKVVQV
ncbi:hypothetical protein TrRE_jg4096, partial [Triparma retinervis]